MQITREFILSAPTEELIRAMLETYGSEENQRRICEPERFRYLTGIGRPVFAKAFPFKTLDYYSDPDACLRAQLQWKLYTYHIIRDSAPLDLDVGVDYSTAYEPSLLGMKHTVKEGMEPTYGAPEMEEADELHRLQKPDFFTSGLMPQAHAMYAALQQRVGDRLRVFFPGWSRGPWSIATIARGFEGVFLDYKEEPDKLHKLMQFAVDSRISWEKQRCAFLGIDPRDRTYRWNYIAYRHNTNSDLFEDEVDGNLFSLPLFREMILPYEKQLCEFYGGIGYYHSCGNLTKFLDDIYSELDIFGVQHVSSWTDYDKAAEVVPQNVTLQVSLHTTKETLGASDETLENLMRSLMERSRGHRVDICADALYEGGWDTLERGAHLARLFEKVMREGA
ncbi:MAG: uroporphyrinogen decarboxylase family protein [Oscillospiraceae bacterium]|nr:uroporphyrinogen decarboxylase family protein [Oscillospiraceae bacterium]